VETALKGSTLDADRAKMQKRQVQCDNKNINNNNNNIKLIKNYNHNLRSEMMKFPKKNENLKFLKLNAFKNFKLSKIKCFSGSETTTELHRFLADQRALLSERVQQLG
jgi:hypothetical protein